MKRNTLLIILTLVLSLFFKENAKAQSKKITIKGVIDTVPHARYRVNYWNNSVFVIDTITLDAASKFEYTAEISEPTNFSLNIKQVDSLRVGFSTVYSFWVEPGKVISFVGKTGWLVKGTESLTTRFKQFDLKNSITEITERNFDKSYNEVIAVWEKKTGQAISRGRSKLLYDSLKTDFIRKNPNDYYSLYLLSLKLSAANFENYEKTLNTLSQKIRNTNLGKELSLQISAHRFTGIGRVMPEFEQADTSSKMVKLSDFRGKYVLVDFWSSWCLPCRAENPYLLSVYKKYASKGFEIISISLDKNKADWLKAILEDQLPWVHVSDLQGFNNSVAKSSLVRTIPDNFLLDPNGVIIAKHLRGNMLEQKMDLLFKAE